MFRLLWALLLPLMTGGRCHRRKKMVGRGAKAGCGTEESPCPVSGVAAEFPAAQPGNSENLSLVEIDYYSQARKTLSERSPFDVAEEASTSTVPTLPSGLASLLNRHADSRRRHKKSHSGTDKKKSRAGERARGGSSIWDETEEYFRDLTLPDIDTLFEASSSFRLATRRCFSIPILGNAPGLNLGSSDIKKENGENLDSKLDSEIAKSEDAVMEIDTIAAETLPQGDKDKGCASSDSSCTLEWLLGCRNKISLTSERPSKKRKLLGGDAGLEKVVIGSPCAGDSLFCHYCCRGDICGESNRVLVCVSCKVAVHQKCYGVQDYVATWFCTWCKQKDGIDESVNPCVLCPKKGGALKPVNRSEERAGSGNFAHLFCCLWMPEVYIEDLQKMEPVMNVGEIKDSRSKLVCHVCKVKCGACVRCSHGTCRTSFHPICAREARYRMEVWAKYGCDDIELRAFCSKHSGVQENFSILPSESCAAVGSECSVAKNVPVMSSVDKTQNVKSGRRNGDNMGMHLVAFDGSPDKSSHVEQEIGLSDSSLNSAGMLESGGVQQLNNGVLGSNDKDVLASGSISFALVLKKLIDRGKVDPKDVALETGISADTLNANLNEACMAPDVRCKVLQWLKTHVYANAFQKGLKVKLKSANSYKDGSGTIGGSEALPMSDFDTLDPVAVKSDLPRRKTVGNIRISKDNKVLCPPVPVSNENEIPIDKATIGESDQENPGTSREAPIPDATEMILTKSGDTFPEGQGNVDKPSKSSFSRCVSEEKFASMSADQNRSVYSIPEPTASGFINAEAVFSYIHPYISQKLLQIHNGILSDDIKCSVEEGNFSLHKSSCGCLNDQNRLSTRDDICKLDEVLKSCPEDEVEGELIYLQHKLLQNAVARTISADKLIYTVAKSLPQEIDGVHQQKWDAVIVNKYLCDLREAKKQGRKERRHKEAQAVLAAATAAAAASSRVLSFRKDTLEESAQQENLLKSDTYSGRTSVCSQPLPRAKETLSRVAVARTSSEKYSDFSLPTSDFSKEHPRSCDICRRSETILNPILVCASCKVAVHLACYRSIKETTGPWYCELCEDMSSRSFGAPAVNFWEKPYFVAECGLCGGTTGAFRKSSDGQWVHAFCAEWVFESTFRRGQVNAVEGMGSVLKGVDVCCICHRKHGVCIKCSYGHCQTTFHPSCARSAGLYMNVRTTGGKLQHRAYCEKHGVEQRAKAETQKHGIEELKSLKQIRVELERLRLLCERIVKREKIKRELVPCSHDILAFKRDHVARSVLVNSPFFLPDGSSESATTSLKGNTEGYRSCSEAVQRSDDVTVDSLISAKHRVRVAVTMDTDPKLDDSCSTPQSHYNHKIQERVQFSGKQIPHRDTVTSRSILDGGGWKSKSRKHSETFGKELVMTSDEASMKNLMLPKGYAYVPADCLSNDKQNNQDLHAGEPQQIDG